MPRFQERFAATGPGGYALKLVIGAVPPSPVSWADASSASSYRPRHCDEAVRRLAGLTSYRRSPDDYVLAARLPRFESSYLARPSTEGER